MRPVDYAPGHPGHWGHLVHGWPEEIVGRCDGSLDLDVAIDLEEGSLVVSPATAATGR